jgi:hypothetical protein
MVSPVTDRPRLRAIGATVAASARCTARGGRSKTISLPKVSASSAASASFGLVAEPVAHDPVDDLEPLLLSGMDVRPRHRAARYGQQLAHRPRGRVLGDARVLARHRVVHDRPGRKQVAQLRRGQRRRGHAPVLSRRQG